MERAARFGLERHLHEFLASRPDGTPRSDRAGRPGGASRASVGTAYVYWPGWLSIAGQRLLVGRVGTAKVSVQYMSYLIDHGTCSEQPGTRSLVPADEIPSDSVSFGRVVPAPIHVAPGTN